MEKLNNILKSMQTCLNGITCQSVMLGLSSTKDFLLHNLNYLNELSEELKSHTNIYKQNEDNIKNLQQQTEKLLNAVGKISPDVTINDLLTTLNEEFNLLKENINTFTNNFQITASDITAQNIAAKEELNGDLNKISSAQGEISNININVSKNEGEINLLQENQNMLQEVQSLHANAINNLNTRLSACEEDYNSLNGQYDLSEINEELAKLEQVNGPACAYEEHNFHNATPLSKTLYTREYYYSCEKEMVHQEFVFKYKAPALGTLIISVYENQVQTGEVYTINLKDHPTECKITRCFLPKTKANNVMLKCECSEEVTFKSFQFWLFGKNVVIYNYNLDVKLVVFDGKIFLTRYHDDCIKYGMFTHPAEIDINNLPNSKPYHQGFGCCNYEMYTPIAEHKYLGYKLYKEEGFIVESAEQNKYLYLSLDGQDKALSLFFTGNGEVCGGEIFPLVYTDDVAPVVRDSEPRHYYSFYTSYEKHNGLSNYKEGEWLYATMYHKNNSYLTDRCQEMNNMRTLAKNEDGWFYAIIKRKVSYVLPICQGGIFATCFTHNSSELRIYVSFGNYVKQYLLDASGYGNNPYRVKYVATHKNCSCILELIDGYKLKKVGNNWQMVEPADL